MGKQVYLMFYAYPIWNSFFFFLVLWCVYEIIWNRWNRQGIYYQWPMAEVWQRCALSKLQKPIFPIPIRWWGSETRVALFCVHLIVFWLALIWRRFFDFYKLAIHVYTRKAIATSDENLWQLVLLDWSGEAYSSAPFKKNF